ncbi:CBN-SEC-31 protein [Caenorhabditis brenneri]|uniref:CBN-SEC-31 protein n=1 Tax=Caenorhabditis brenneri TaxID=135651 RepID=G0P6S1_CAEBE|nr:CBN-SEC-31 protein [Caenorhabditis brenneri]
MSSKLYSRSGVFAWSPRGVPAKGLVVADFAQFFDLNASSIEQKIDFLTAKCLNDKPNLVPDVSINTNYRFNELAWTSMCSDAHPNGIIAGGTEDGTVVFFDAEKLIKTHTLDVLSSRKDHHGHVLTIDVSRDGRWMASGGGSGQILLWDCANLKTPFSPGAPNFPDQVKLLRWNQKNESVFASISSRRVSFWDLRRNGSPVLEFAEIPGCDWSSLCWNPSDASQLILASQSQHASVIQKWDSRFTSTPVKEYRHHNMGVTSVDWNKADDRLMISSGCDGQVVIWNHETSEVLGGVGSLQGDWIRSVKWNEEEPSQFAIQYFQHPVQISSLTSLGVPQPGAEVLATRVSDQFVPAWHRAPLIGSSVSLGGRLATFWKSYDVMSQQLQHNVEVETIFLDEDIGADDVAQYLHIKDDKRNLGWYLHEKAHEPSNDSSEDSELRRKVWLFILAMQEGAGRTKMLHYLGLVEAPENKVFSEQAQPTSENSTSYTNHTTTTNRTERSTSVVSAADTDVGMLETSILDRCCDVNFSALDSSGWELLRNTVRQDHIAVIRVLMSSNQHVAAMMYAAQHDTDHLTMILEDYNKKSNNTNQLSSLMLALSNSSSSHRAEQTDPKQTNDAERIRKIEVVANSFPDQKWMELLGLFIAHECDIDDIRLAAKTIGRMWLNQGKSLRACIALIIGGDIENLLIANTSFSLSDRIKQALILHQVSGQKFYTEELEKLIITFANRLLVQGAAQTAWNLVKRCENGSAEMQELQWTCYNVAGGRDCTGDQAPFNPYNVQPAQQQQHSSVQPIRQFQHQHPSVLPPQTHGNSYNQYNPAQSQAPPPPMDYSNVRRTSNIAPMPPSSTFYQTPSWNHKPPPTMPPNMPPPKPAAPVTPGWNDPPPMALKTSPTPQPKQNVMEFNWKPVEAAPAPGGMMMGQQQNGYLGRVGYQNMISNGVQGMTIQNQNSSAASSVYPSPTSYQQRPPSVASVAATPPIQLSPEDEKLVEPINALAQFIIENSRVQARMEKATDLKTRIQAELAPRLAANRLSAETKQHLTHLAYFISMRQIREAQAVVSQMARNSSDFVEISSFLPALKSLLSLATH